MNRKDELTKIIKTARKELNDIEDKESEKLSSSLVGKFFKYENHCGGDEPNQHWWYYKAATGISKNGLLTTWAFQDDKAGRITIEDDADTSMSLSGNYIEITATEFWKAWNKILEKLDEKESL